MTRWITIGLFALGLGAHRPVTAQTSPPYPNGSMAGGVVGSLAGEVLWLSVGGIEKSGPDLAFAAATVLGSSVGAWAMADGERPNLGYVLAGASVGLVAGFGLATVLGTLAESGRSSSRSVLPAIGIGFAVGQGTVTAAFPQWLAGGSSRAGR
jgi:hypothetical protein